jgi:hypothetical protein
MKRQLFNLNGFGFHPFAVSRHCFPEAWQYARQCKGLRRDSRQAPLWRALSSSACERRPREALPGLAPVRRALPLRLRQLNEGVSFQKSIDDGREVVRVSARDDARADGGRL